MFQNSLMLLFPGVHCRIRPRNGASLWVWSLRKPSEFEHKAFESISFAFSFLLIVLTLLLFRASQMGCSLTWWGKSTGIWDAWNVWKAIFCLKSEERCAWFSTLVSFGQIWKFCNKFQIADRGLSSTSTVTTPTPTSTWVKASCWSWQSSMQRTKRIWTSSSRQGEVMRSALLAVLLLLKSHYIVF